MASESVEEAAILFARSPVRGQVKTRLQPHLSPDDSLALHRALVADAATLLRQAAGRRAQLLSPGHDLDTREDLLRTHIAPSAACAACCCTWVSGVGAKPYTSAVDYSPMARGREV